MYSEIAAMAMLSYSIALALQLPEAYDMILGCSGHGVGLSKQRRTKIISNRVSWIKVPLIQIDLYDEIVLNVTTATKADRNGAVSSIVEQSKTRLSESGAAKVRKLRETGIC